MQISCSVITTSVRKPEIMLIRCDVSPHRTLGITSVRGAGGPGPPYVGTAVDTAMKPFINSPQHKASKQNGGFWGS